MVEESLKFAQSLQEKVTANIDESERIFHQKMQKLLNNPENKVMLIELLDRSFRCKNKAASFDLIEHTLN
ncbi:hypothetical protein, partial [Campylobacter avium]